MTILKDFSEFNEYLSNLPKFPNLFLMNALDGVR